MYSRISRIFAIAFVFCISVPTIQAADINLLPLSSIKVVVSPSSTKHMVKYVVFNSSSSTNYNLVLQPIKGLTAQTGLGFCGNAFRLAKKKSCILALEINAAKMRNPTKGGPKLCKKEDANVCFTPIAKDQLNLSRHNWVSFKPLSNVKLTVPSNRTAKVYYQVLNLKPEGMQLSLKAIPGIESLGGIKGPVPYCGNNFKLGQRKSCLLVLQITGSKIPNRIKSGPLVCINGKDKCYQPLPGKRLDITKGLTTYLARIEAQELFPISLVQGSNVLIHIKNTSSVNAKGIKVIEHPELTCPTLAHNMICTLSYKAATNLDVGTYPFTVKGSNTNTIHGQITVTSSSPPHGPKINKITPSSGSQQGHEQISIEGENLQPNPQVYLGNKRCADVGGTNNTITATTPAQFQGTPINTSVDVKVKTGNGEFVLTNGFTYQAAAPSCADGQKNGDETAKDCGGSCGACSDGLRCHVGSDCQSSICVNEVCQTPACGDGSIQGNEVCDDENSVDGDGCSSSCTFEPGFICTGEQRSSCVDINECVMDNGGCDPNATCINTLGSHMCQCYAGFSGNGITCTADIVCPSGTYVSVSGSPTSTQVCSACPMGTYSKTENATSCDPWSSCAAGTYVNMAGTATSDQSCAPCEAGSYSSTTNTGSCSPWSSCSPGTYMSSAGTNTSDVVCSMCAAGTYSTTTNAESCSICPNGTTSFPGSTSCN